MESKKTLEELNKKYEELARSLEQVRQDIVLFENAPQYAEYEASTPEERKEKFPDKVEMYEKYEELDKNVEELYQEVLTAVSELYKDIAGAIKTFKERIEQNQQERDKLEQESVELREQLKELKKTPEYKSGDEAIHAQAEEMQAKLKKLATEKGKLTRSTNMFLKEITGLEEKLEELVTEYGEEVVVKEEEQPTKEGETQEQTEQEVLTEEQGTPAEEQISQEEAQKQMQIIFLQKELEEVQSEWQVAETERANIYKELMELKASEEYQKGDSATVNKVNELEKALEEQVVIKTAKANKLKEIRDKINKLEGREVIGRPDATVQEKTTTQPHMQGSSPTQTQTSKDETKQTPTKKTQKRVVISPEYVGETGSGTPEKQAQEAREYTKKEFDELYVKAKKGTLTQEEFYKLAEIMQDEKSYDKLGITTGRIFNKSKKVLKAMARMTASTAKTAILSRERLGLAAEDASKENGYLSTSSLWNWKGIKELIDNPEQKIASEELFKKITALDRDTLGPGEQEVWDRAQEHLNKFGSLRGCLATYSNVVRARTTSKGKDDVKIPLPEATKTEKTIGDDRDKFADALSDAVREVPDDPVGRTANTPNLNKDAR